MIQNLDTYAAGLKVDRALRRSQSAPKTTSVAPVGAPCGHLTNVLGFLRRGRRPAMA
jgi:hypothetical protein